MDLGGHVVTLVLKRGTIHGGRRKTILRLAYDGSIPHPFVGGD